MQSGDSTDNVPRSDAWRNNNAEKIAYGMDRYSWNQGYNALYDFQMFEEQEPALVARGGQRSFAIPKGDRCLVCIGS